MRIKSGVSGFDTLIDGGFPENSVILLSGSAGTGKTIFSMQFLLEGLKKKEKTLFITFEQRKEKVFDQASRFGWELQKYEKQGMVKIVTMDDVGIINILEGMRNHIDSFKPSRMVIDSITFMALSAYSVKKLVDLEKTSLAEIYEEMEEHYQHSIPPEYAGLIVRKLLVDFVKILQSKNITAILTSEIPRESAWLSRDTFSEFASDGVILLKSTSIGSDLHRTIEVIKMRNTKMKGGVYSFEFGKNGISVKI